MNLRCTPTLFRKLDVYHQLIDYEKEADIKPIWKAEKIVLLWAVSKEHRDVGSFIRTRNIKATLEAEVKQNGKLGTDAIDYAVNKQQQVLEALVAHGFGEMHTTTNHVRINQNGFIAGKILKDTDYLKNTLMFRIWTWVWWIVLSAAALILLDQSVGALFGILEKMASLFCLSE